MKNLPQAETKCDDPLFSIVKPLIEPKIEIRIFESIDPRR